MNECLLRAATSGDIPRLQVLRCVPGPMRALTAPGSHSEVADLGCRSCCDLAPMSRIETGAFGPAEAQGKHADFRSTPFVQAVGTGVALASDVSRLQSAPVPWTASGRAVHRPRWLRAVGCGSRLCGRETALMMAAGKGDTRMAEVLIAAGADVGAKDHRGYGRAPNGCSCAPLDREASARQVDCAACRCQWWSRTGVPLHVATHIDRAGQGAHRCRRQCWWPEQRWVGPCTDLDGCVPSDASADFAAGGLRS